MRQITTLKLTLITLLFLSFYSSFAQIITLKTPVWSRDGSANKPLAVKGMSTGDVNGDGLLDFVIQPNILHLGRSNSFFSNTNDWAIAAGYVPHNRHGLLGDHNGDGKKDIVEIFNNQIAVFYASSTGLPTMPSKTHNLAGCDGCGSEFSFDANGDINKDGYDDLVIGAAYTSHFLGNRGSVYIVYGSAIGLNFDAILEVTIPAFGVFWGRNVRFGGDINRDGFDDILVATESWNGQDFDETLYIIYGKTGELGEPIGVGLGGREREAYAHEIGAAGDINGDGFADFYISAEGRNNYSISSRGAIEIVYGKNTTNLDSNIVELLPANILEVNEFGKSVCSAGDFNNDGFSDIAVTNNLKVLIYLGSQQGLMKTPRFEFNANSNPVVRFAGDIDKDGFSDLLIGEQEFNFGAGRVYLLRGRTSMIPEFSVENRELCMQNPVAIFQDSSIEAVSRKWDFGDGTFSTETNPQHRYNQAGIYSVKLTTKNARGHEWTMLKENFIVVRSPLQAGTYTIGEEGVYKNIDTINIVCKCGLAGNVTFRFKNGVHAPPTLRLENVDTKNFNLTFEAESGNRDSVIMGDIWRFPYNWKAAPNIILKNTKNVTFRKITIKRLNEYNEPTVQVTNCDNIRFESCIFPTANTQTCMAVQNVKNLSIDSCGMGRGFPFLEIKKAQNIRINGSYGMLQGDNSIEDICAIFVDSTKNFLATQAVAVYINIKNSENTTIEKSRRIEVAVDSCLKTSIIKNGDDMSLNISNSWGFKILNNRHHSKGAYNLNNTVGLNTEGYNIIANNLIGFPKGTQYYSSGGVHLIGSKNVRFYHNTIVFESFNGESCKGVNLRVQNADSIDVRNNLFIQDPNAEGCSVVQIDNNQRYTANFNAYCNARFFNIDVWNSHSVMNFENFKAAVGQDQNSVNGEMYMNSDLLTPLPQYGGLINGVAPYLAQIAEDIDGKIRPQTGVDIGALEFDLTNYRDFSLDTLNNQALFVGNNTISVRLSNRGTTSADSVRLAYQLDNEPIVREKWIGQLNAFSPLVYNFTTPLSISKGRVYTLKVWLENINEGTRINDTLQQVFGVPMVGNYKIGNNSADFENIITLYQHLGVAGMQGDVTVLLQEGTYHFEDSNIEFNFLYPAKEIQKYWLTFKGDANDPAKVHFAYNFLQQPYLRFENITLKAVNYPISQESAGTQHHVYKAEIINCVVQSENEQNTLYDFTINADTSLVVKNTKFINLREALKITMLRDNNDKKLWIENCHFTKVGVGIRCENYNLTDLKIIKNTLDTAEIGLYLVGIGSDTRDTNQINTRITQNKIINCKKAGIAGAALYYCLIANNFIHSYNNSLELTNTKACKITHNSCFGTFYYDQNDFETYILNNSFVAPDTAFYGSLYHRQDLSLFYRSNNNNYFSLNGKPFKIIHHNDNDRLEEMTLRAFSEYFNTDKRSISVNPRYESMTDMHIDINSPLNGAGSGIHFGVNTDFDGQERDSVNNDIGADEIKTPSVVMPGDANFDGKVNNLDLLPIGIGIAQQITGVPRLNGSIEWLPQASTNWNSEILGKNAKHADTNGDGFINYQDTFAVSKNYNNTHTQHLRGRSVGTPLYFTNLPKKTTEGNWVTADINLGTSLERANGVYGAFFSILYDTTKIIKGSFSIRFDTSWLTNTAPNLTLFKDYGRVDIGIVRTDGLNISGYGKIASVHFQIKDASFGKTIISLIEGQVFSFNGSKEETQTKNDSVIIQLKTRPIINILLGTSQVTPINKPFLSPLTVQIKDGSGKVMPNIAVKFVFPTGNLPSATLNGSSIVQTTTNTEGVAQITNIMANSFVGSYYVTVLLDDSTSNRILLRNEQALPITENTVEHIAVFPTQTHDIIKIRKAKTTEKLNFYLYDINGKMVLQTIVSEENTEINISNLSTGLYFVRCCNNAHELVQKIIKF